MRILIATGLYPPESGGPATYTKLLEEKLPPHGFEVSVLPFSTVRHLPKLIRHAVYFWKCINKASRADVVYAQDTLSVGLPAALASFFSGKKFVVRVPGDYAWEQARQRFGVEDDLDAFQKKRYGFYTELLRTLQRFVVRRARAVVVPSEYMKRIAEEWAPGKVHRIYSSVKIPTPKNPNRPQGFFVVTVARPVPWKGLDGLRRVVAREKHWNLRIINDLPYAEAMGWVKAADVFVLNSTYEGLSHALVEAMTLGTPVIATRAGGNIELVADQKTGLLIPPENDDALYAALKNIEQDRRAAQLRAEAAQRAVLEFSIEKTIIQLVELLQKL